jgi:glycosyltransferase involved in cell wall biosynthesis
VRIAIDARKLHDFGIGTYVRNLLAQLGRIDPDTDYVALCRADDQELIRSFGANLRPVVEPAAPYSLAEQFRVPLSLKRIGADLFHAPHYVLPPLTRRRSIVTIHDCIHLMVPEYLPNRLAYGYAKAFLWSATQQADRILTVSEASKRDILRLFDVPAEKVVVIYNAIDERFNATPAEEDVARVRQRYQLDDDYVLYVGNIKPHKNVERLIDAFAQVRQAGFDRLKLLVIGDEITRYAGLRRAVHRCKLHGHVRFLGHLPTETLAILYRLAAVFVFPSLYEGFGLPPLEAMASGTPVVTSNISSLPEIVGDAAVLVDPYDVTSIANGIRRVLTDTALREKLRCRGLERARHYSWERSVRQIRAIYAEVLRSA